MKPLAALLLATAWFVAAPAGAQEAYKCRDAAGKITYSSRDCASQGLKDAGEIKDNLQVTPAVKVAPRPAAAPSPAQAKPAPQPAKQAAQEPEKAKERRCFKTPKGYRCNDVPEEDKSESKPQ